MNDLLTIVVLTLNEEIHLERMLESVRELNARIVVVDSGSDDSTVCIAERYGCDVYHNPWINYAKQFQWGLDNCGIKSKWVMRMDADEYLEHDLIKNVCKFLTVAPSEVSGFFVKRKVVFMGRWIRHGGHYPQTLLRFWRNGEARIEQRWMDEHMSFSDSQAKLGLIPGHIVDENLNTVTWWIEKHNKYASREAVDILLTKLDSELVENVNVTSGWQAYLKRLLKNGVYNKLPLALRSSLYFLYRYFIRLGFLDGKAGFFYHFMQGYWYRTLVDLKVSEYEHNSLSANKIVDPIVFFKLKK